MNAFRRVAQNVARRILNEAIGSSRELAQFLSRFDTETEIGIDVTPDVAMRFSTVYSCVRVLAEDIAKLPLIVYKKTPNGRERVDDFWLTRLLAQPNPFQTGFEFREMQQAHIELSGDFYAIKTIVRGEIRELLPVPPWRMTCELLPNWTLKYTLQMPDGTMQPIPTENVYHVRGLSLNGFKGISPVGYARETISFAIGLRKYGNKLFRNGANVGGVLQHPGELSEEAALRLKQSFEEKYANLDNAHKVLLLEEGTTFQTTGMKADDAQFLESRKYTRSEICGIYRVPPHMVGDLERATFSNIEQQSLDYVQNGLLGRVRRLEARMAMALLKETERKDYYVEHLLDGLLRGDFKTRMSGYQIAILSGWMNRNEVRRLENMNPGPSELDEYLAPTNMTTAQLLTEPEPEPEPAPALPSDPQQQPKNPKQRALHAL